MSLNNVETRMTMKLLNEQTLKTLANGSHVDLLSGGRQENLNSNKGILNNDELL